MNLLPSIAPTISSSNIADLFTTKTLSRHRFNSLIGDIHSPTPSTLVVTATVDTAPAPPVVASTATVDHAPTVVASATTATSDSVPPLHPNLEPASTLPIVLDTGASFSLIPFKSDFLSGAPFGLIRSAASVASQVDLYTLITGEDTATTTSDLSSPDLFDLASDSVDTFKFATAFEAFEVLEFREFGTATLIFISDPHTDRKTILVEPILDRFDWLDWIPLPRLTSTESYYHVFGLDYSQAFALFHLNPIWIYCLLHFGLE